VVPFNSLWAACAAPDPEIRLGDKEYGAFQKLAKEVRDQVRLGNPQKAVVPASRAVEHDRSSPGAALLTTFNSTAPSAEDGRLSNLDSMDESRLPNHLVGETGGE
jgi:hypothetical protein